MRVPVPQASGLENIAGTAAVAGFVAVPTGLPLAEMVAEWLPGLPAGSSGPLLVAVIWVVAFAWFWAGVRAQADRLRGLER